MTITLQADIYDTLEFSALAFGGIGKGRCFTDGSITGVDPAALPVCLVGHAYAAHWTSDFRAQITIGAPQSDAAVLRINRRKGRPRETRVSWGEYCAELSIVRGD